MRGLRLYYQLKINKNPTVRNLKQDASSWIFSVYMTCMSMIWDDAHSPIFLFSI